jgi:hypothetical protein
MTLLMKPNPLHSGARVPVMLGREVPLADMGWEDFLALAGCPHEGTADTAIALDTVYLLLNLQLHHPQHMQNSIRAFTR